jgi:Winged helix-turn helix
MIIEGGKSVGLLPGDVEIVRRGRASMVPANVREEIDRLKALYHGFHYRELARIVFCKCAYPIDDKTVKLLWQQSPVPTQQQLELWNYHSYPERYQARLQVVKLYYQGWDKLSISRFLQVSRPTVDTWIARFEAEHFAGLVDKKRGPKEPPRKVWLPRPVWMHSGPRDGTRCDEQLVSATLTQSLLAPFMLILWGRVHPDCLLF